MKVSFEVKRVVSTEATIEDIKVTAEYTPEELIAILQQIPQLINILQGAQS